MKKQAPKQQSPREWLDSTDQANKQRKAGGLSRLFAVLGGVLALLAVILLVNYLIQGNKTRHEQTQMQALYEQGEALSQNEENVQPSQLSTQPPLLQAEATSAPLAPQEQAEQVQQAPDAYAATQRDVTGDRFLPLLRRNPDVVGWLNYPVFPEMDYAVMHRDNAYYMDRSFSGEKNLAGSVFLDEGNSIRPRDTNLILHGHNMKNGTMFGRLARLMEPSVFKAQPLISFDTLYQDAYYVPYAVTVFSVNPASPNYFSVNQANFDTNEEMGEYVNWLRARSSLVFPTLVSPSDNLLTLVTCHGLDDDERLAIALRAVLPGEVLADIKQSFVSGLYRP